MLKIEMGNPFDYLFMQNPEQMVWTLQHKMAI